MRLQTILLPTEEICNVEELYFHRRGAYLDFDGYFNLFQIAKRKRYTGITGLKLQLELAGYSEIRLMNDRKQVGSCPLDAGQRKRYTFDFPYGEADGVFWFALKRDAAAPEAFLQGYFFNVIKRKCYLPSLCWHGVLLCALRTYCERLLFVVMQHHS